MAFVVRSWEQVAREVLKRAGLSPGGAVDLSNYYTKAEVDSALAGVDAPDLSRFAVQGDVNTSLTDVATQFANVAVSLTSLNDLLLTLRDGVTTTVAAVEARLEALETAPPVDLSPYAQTADMEAADQAVYDRISTLFSAADQALQAQIDTLAAVPPPDLTPYAETSALTASVEGLRGLIDDRYTKAEVDAAIAAVIEAVKAEPPEITADKPIEFTGTVAIATDRGDITTSAIRPVGLIPIVINGETKLIPFYNPAP